MAGLIRKISREWRRKKEEWKQQLALSVAAGMLFMPFSVQASEIAKQDSNLQNTVQQNGKVYNIYADKVNGDVAFSEYAKFNLSAGDIANMRFNTLNGGADVNNLINVVNSRINVDGTINAIRNNAVGGNLFFVSEKGMTVGAGGVINAGSINIIAPTGSAVDLIKEHFNENGDNGTKLPERLKNGYYAVNPSGTIQIAGKLNTVDGITMQAGTINIQNGAALKSLQSMNYSDVVNISGVDSGITTPGTLTASENANGDIVLSAVAESTSATEEERETWKGEGEAIIGIAKREAVVTVEAGSTVESRGAAKITAEASNEDDVWRLPDSPDSFPELLGTVDNPLGQVTWVSAKVDIGGTVTGQSVNIDATAYNQYNSLNDTSKLSDISQDVINIDKFSKHYDWIKKLHDMLGVDIMYSYLDSVAEVDIRNTAVVTAKGADIDTGKTDNGSPVLSPALSITANSKTRNLMTAQTKTEKGQEYQKKDAKRAGEDNTDNEARKAYQAKTTTHYGSLSALFGGSDTSAVVNIEGTVKAEQGSAEIKAVSDNYYSIKSTVNTVTKSANATDSRIDAAIGVVVTDNNSAVSIAEGASVYAAKNLTVGAETKNSHELTVTAQASAKALVATAIAIMDEDSKADVTVNGALTADGGELSLNAKNTLSRNTLSVSNSFTGKKPLPSAGDSVNEKGDIEVDELSMPLLGKETGETGVNGLLGDIRKDVDKKLDGTDAVKSNPETARGLSDYFKAGGSIGVSVENNDSTVSIGSAANISSGSALTVDALTDLQDTHMMSIGSLVNADPNATSLINADGALLVTVFDNNAVITVTDGVSSATGQHATLSGGTVSMNAKVNEAYGRDKGVWNDFSKMWSDLVAIGDLVQDDGKEEYDKTVEDIGTAVNDIRLALIKMTGLDIDDYIGNTITIPTNVTELGLEVMGLASGLEKFVEGGKNGFRNEYNTITATINKNLMQFVRPESYVNFIAAASSNSVGAADPVFETVGDVSLAGAVNVNVLDNHARVDVGKYAEIKAKSGQASILADAEQNTVVMNGRPNIDINIAPILDLAWGENAAEKRAALVGENKKETCFNIVKQMITVRPNSSGTNAIGGTVGVMEASTAGKVSIGDYAVVSGYAAPPAAESEPATDSILIRANDETVLTDITFGAGVSGKIGFEGMFAWLGGNIDTGVDMGQGVTVEAMSADDAPAYGNVRVESIVNAVMTNLVGEISITDGMAAGMAAGITDYSVDNIINMQKTAEDGSTQVPVTVKASGLDVAALTDGVINTISLAGTVATLEAGDTTNENTTQNEKIGVIEGEANDKTEEATKKSNDSVKNGIILTDNPSQQNEDTGSAKDALLGTPEQESTVTPAKAPKLNIGGSGSVAVNIIDARTEANLNNVEYNVYNTVDDGKDVTVTAEDASFAGAWSGSTAVTWKKTVKLDEDKQLANQVAHDPTGKNAHKDSEGTKTKEKDANKSVSVAFAGAVAVNDADQTVVSSIRNSRLKHVANIRNTAEKDGALVAAGIAASVSKTSGSESMSFDGAASASYNKGDGAVTALLENNSVNNDGEAWSGKTNIQNLAMISDTDVAGGIDLTLSLGGKYGFGAGGSLAVSDITNTLSAEAKGGTYFSIGTFQNHAAADLTAVATAVAASVSLGSSGFNFDAALALNHLDNTAQASVHGDEGSSIVIGAGSVDVAAYDANHLNKSFDQYISDSYLDPSMDTYLQEVGSDMASKDGTDPSMGGVSVNYTMVTDDDGKTTAQPNGYTINPIDVSDGGTDIGTVALTISAGTKSAGANAAAAVGLISNDFRTDVTNATIMTRGVADSENNLHGLDVSANADSLLVNISGGVAASGGSFNGAGSVSVQQTDDTVSAVVEKSTVVSPELDIEATTGNRNVNIAGQVAAGKNGAGLALAYNSLDNDTVANLLSSNVSPAEDGQASNVSVAASNGGGVYSFAVGVAAGSTSAVNGSISLNFGQDNLEARIGVGEEENAPVSKIGNAGVISVTSVDDSRKVSVAGGVSGAGTAAVGGSVAYNELGNYHTDAGEDLTEPDKQVNRAAIEKTEITTQNAYGASVTVSAKDVSHLDTASAAAGGAGSAAVEGTATVSRLGRVTRAEMSGTDIDKDAASGRSFANTKVSADSSGNIFNGAIMFAGSGAASVGAGVSVMEDSADVAASLSDSTIHAGELSVRAATEDTALTIGVGASGGTYAGIAGSVAVNLLNGYTRATVADSVVTSENNVSVAAMSDTSLDNYAGTVTFAAEGAAVGVSVSVNDIQNETGAGISGAGTQITARSSGTAVTLADTVNDSEIIHDFVNTTGNMTPTYPLNRSDSDYKGIAVSSSSTNKINSLVVNAGFAAIGGQVAGTVNVNLIGGKTEASVTDGGRLQTENQGDVAVVAHDYANSSAFTGTIGGAGIGASIGFASNTNQITRETVASVTGPETAGAEEQITAHGLRVEAEAKQGIGSVDVGVAVAGIGAGISNTDDVSLLDGRTKAELSHTNATLSGDLSVSADHRASLYTLTVTGDVGVVGAGIGLNINVIEDESDVAAVLEQDTIQFADNAVSSVAVTAKNNVTNDFEIYSLGGSGIGASVNGAISYGSSDSTVTASVADTSVGTSEKRAENIDIAAENFLRITQQDWNASVGGASAGVGIGVNIATVDSTTSTVIKDSSLFAAGDVNVTATENRTVHNLNGNTIGAGLGAVAVNVSVVTVGKAVQDRYSVVTYSPDGEEAEIDSGADMANAYKEGQDAIDGNVFQADYAYGYVAEDSAATKTAVLKRGGPEQAQDGVTDETVSSSKVTTALSGVTVDTQGTANINSDAVTNADIQAMSFGASTISVNGSVAVLDTHRNAGAEMENVSITAKEINAGAHLSGSTDTDIYQGGLSPAAAGNGAFGFVDNAGNAGISVGSNNTFTAGSAINFETDDTTTTDIDIFSVAAAEVAAGGIQVSSADAVSRNGIVIGDANRFTADTINVNAKNTPVLNSHVNGINASFLVSGNISVASANAGKSEDNKHIAASLSVGDGNLFNAGTAGSVSLNAVTDVRENAYMRSLDASLVDALLLNFNDANVYSDTTVSVGENTYVAETLTVSGKTAVTETMDAAGVVATLGAPLGGAVANNAQGSVNRINTTVTVAGSSDFKGTSSGEQPVVSSINKANIGSASSVTVTGNAQSYGGAISGSGIAAELDFELTNNTTAALQGTWNLDDKLQVTALNSETIDLDVDTVAAAIVNASAGLLDSNVTQKAGVSVADAKVTSKGDQVYIAGNNMAGDTLEILASGYGGLGVAASDLDQDHTYTATLDISNSELISDGSIKAGSSVTGDFTTDNTVRAAGVIPLVFADSDQTTTYDNRINVTGSNLKTTGDNDIILSASENTILDFSTIGDNQLGLIGATSADANNTLSRTGAVNVSGTSNLDSAGGIAIRAGKDLDGRNTSLDFRIVSDAYNSSIVPVEFSASLDNNMSQANTVTVGEGVNGTSVGDINLTAYSGKTKLAQNAKSYNIWTGGDQSEDSGITVTTGNAYPDNETVSNSVSVAGTLTAGIHNAAAIGITGNPSYDTGKRQQIADLVQQYNNTTDSSEKQVLEQQIKILAEGLKASFTYDGVSVSIEKGSEILSADDITPETITLENGYYSRYEELKQDMQNSLGTEYYDNYAADMNSLMQEMIAAGFAVSQTDTNGDVHYVVYKNREVAGINLPNMQVSGGDIRIDTPKLAVTGSLTAKGNPEIRVDSGSELYLKVNDAVIVKEGGNIYLNDSGIDSNTKEDSSFTGATNIHAEKTDGALPLVSISNTAGKTDPLFTGDIGIYGKVINHAGDVNIENKNFSIYVTGEGSVAGQNVTIKAENGSVVQNKPDGAVSVGADPVGQWVIDDETAKKIQEKLAEQSSINKSFKNYAEYRSYIKENCQIDLPETQPGTAESERSKGILAGGSVYISGHDVNLNGLVQSGYASYQAELDSDSLNKIETLDNTYAGTVLSDATVLSDSQFAVVNAGAHYDEYTDQYVYTPGVYYNPSTKKLIVDSITTNPGQVVITGNVISTGNGRVFAADGAAEISINTAASDRDVQVNNLSVSSGSGLVSITDHLQNKVFEYQDGKSRSYTIGDPGNVTEGTSSYFTPKDQTFQWTGSVSQTETKTYSYTEKSYAWGIYDTRTDDEIINEYKDDADVTIVAVGGDILNNGTYLKDYDKDKPSGIEPTYADQDRGVFGLYGTTTSGTTVQGTVYKDEWDVGLIWDIYKEVTYTWDETTPKTTSTQYVLRADQPVMVGALKTEGSGNISITAGGGVSLSGNVSALSGGTVTLNSQKGSVVSSDGRVVGNRTDIRAASDINVLHSALAADDTASVKLASANGNITFDSNRGSLSLVQAESGNALGLAAITAERDIVNGASSGAAVQASRIELTSKTGGIGTTDVALAIQAGTEPVSGNSMDASVSAAADGSIFLAQANGNMRIGYIESANGNVTLTAKGSFVNAATNSDTAEATASSHLVTWAKHGLISSEDAADEKTNSAAEAKAIRESAASARAYQLANQKRVKAENESYDDYSSAVATAAGDYKAAAATLADNFAADMNDAMQAYTAAVQEAQKVFDNSGKTEADKAALIDAYKNAFNAYAEARLAYFKSKGYDYSADEAQVVADYIGLQTAQGGWSKNNLLYAMREEIVNSVPGELPEYATPNIKANTITFTSGGIGENSNPVTINRADYENEDNLRLIASAQAGELTWNYEDGKVVSVTVRKETPVVVSTPDAGGVVVNSSGKQVYLATTSPVKDADGNIEEGSTLHILGDINAGTANVKLQAGNGITVENDNGEAGTIIAKDLILHAGQGDAGTTGKPIQTDITGTLDANSDKSVVIRQTGNEHDLTLKSVVAGDAIEITSVKGIEMAPTQSEEASGHLSAKSHINLTALGGGVGKTEAIRVLANDVTVNVDAKDDTNIIGKVNGDDSLVLGTVTVAGGGFTAETDNDIAVGSVQVKNDITLLSKEGAITNSSTVTSEEGSINATAKSDITYNAKIKAGNGIMLKSADGSIVSAPEDSVYLDAGSHLTLQAENGNLGSADNVLRIVNQKAAAIDATAQNAWLKGIANTSGENTDTMTLQTIRVDNVFKAESEGNLKVNEATDENGATIASVEAGTVGMTAAKGISVDGAVTATAGNITATARGDITYNAAITANKEIALQSTDGNIVSAPVADAYLDAGSHLTLQAENGNLGSADNALRIVNQKAAAIDATARNAWLKGMANTSGENTDTMILQTIRVADEFKAESEGNLKVKEATDENGATITSVEAGTVGLTAAKGISVDGAVTAEDDVTAKAKGDVLINSTVDAKTATLTAGNDVIIDRAITVVSDFTAKAKGGIYETESGVLKTTGDKDQVELEAGRGIAFANENNSFIRLNVHGAENESAPGTFNAIDGNVSVTVNGDREWKVIAPEITDADIPVKGILATIGSPVNGNVTLTNVGEDATVVLYKNGIVTNSGEAGEGNVSITTDKAIVVTQGIQAANNVAVTSNTGHVFVKNSLTAKAGSANVSTGEGNIHIGANVASGLGTALTTGNGNIHIGANIASGQGAALTTGNGKITVDNLVTANNGNVSLVTGAGDISVNDKVIARSGDLTEDKGNVTVTTGEGNIHIGDNGENVKTVSADQNITLTTNLGKIHIKGGTESSSGDITMSAKSENYTPGAEGMNILLDGHGKVKAAGYVNLQSENGDVHVTGLVLSDKGLTADIQKQGSVYFDRSVAVSDNVVVTAQKGVIHVDNDVASLNGNITMKTTEGDVRVNNKVISDKGSVTVTTEKGNIHIGDNGENVKTVSADQNVALTTNLGKITIEGETFSKQGNITMSAKSDSYTPGSMNILIGEKGKVQAAGYVNLQAENGDLIVTDRILSGDGLTAEVKKQGSVYFGRDVDVKEKITIYSENGDIQTAGNLVAGNVVELTADAGSVTVLGGVTAIAGNVTATANDAITINKDVKAKQNVILTSENGAITTGSTVTSTAGDIKAEANGDVTTKGALSAAQGLITATSAMGNVKVEKEATAANDVTLSAEAGSVTMNGALTSTAGNIKAEGNGDVTTSGVLSAVKGSITATSAMGNVKVEKEATAANNVTLTAEAGSITVNGAVTSTAGDIKAEANGDVTTKGTLSAAQGAITATSATGNVKVEKEATAANDVTLTAETGSVTVDGAVTSTAGHVIATADGDVTTAAAAAIKANKNVKVTSANGAVQTGGALTAENESVTIKANKDITANGAMQAKKDVLLQSEVGAISAASTVAAETGNVEANANGNVTTNGAVQAKQNVSLLSKNGAITTGTTVTSTTGDIKAEANGDVTTKDKLSAVKGAITATSATGNVKVEKEVTAANDVTLTAETGSVAVDGAVTSTAGHVIATADGDVTTAAAAAIKANKNVKVTSANGAVQTGGALTAENESVTIKANKDITANGAMQAKKDVLLQSEVGAISAASTVAAETGNVEAKANGNVTANGVVQAGQNVLLQSTVGAVTTASTVTAEGGNVAATAKGNITYNAAISANKEIALQSTDGNIVSAPVAGAYLDSGAHISLQAENGNAGSADNALRIQNNSNTAIDAIAKNAWLKGITNDSGDDSDTMTLQTIRVDNVFKAESEGNLKVKEATDENGATITSVEAGTVGLTAAKGISVDGAVTAEDDVTAKAKGDVLINSTVGAKTATLTAGNDIAIGGAVTVDTGFTAKAEGKIYETGSGVLQTKSNQDQVELEAGRSVAFENTNNSFVRLNVHGTESASAPGTYNAIDGNVSITANGDRDWTVSAPEFTDKDIPVKGILATVGSPVNGNVTLTNVGEDATVVLYKNGIVTNAGEAGKGDVSLTADKAIVVTQGIQAANDVAVTSNTGHVFVKNSLTAKEGSVNVSTGEGNIHIGANVASGQSTALTTGNGNIHIGANIASGQDAALKTGNGIITVDNLVASNDGNVSLTTGAGDISVNDKVIARTGSVTATTSEGDIHIGDNGPEENTVYAQQEVLLATDLGHIEISGRTLTQTGDITMKAGENTYVSGQSNFIINDNGRVESGWDVNLEGRNGDIHVTDDIVAQHSINTQIEGQGSVYFDDDLSSNASISITSDQGDINVDKAITSVNGDVSLSTTSGNIRVDGAIKALNDVSVVSDTGNISLRDVTAGSDVSLEIRKSGDIKADNVSAGNLVYTSTGKGDIFLDMASGKAVVIQSQANTPASHIGTIQAEAGGAGTDVAVTGNYINVGSILSKGGSDPLKVELEAPDGEEVISEVAIDNISSGSGTVIPKLWADRGTIHVSNGYLAIGDIYTTDKIHGDNPGTAFALYGRTPTGDGEPHMYWNNVDLPHRRTALLMTDSNVFTRMVDLLDERTYTWLFERDYLRYVLAPEAPWAKHKGVLLYDRRHVVSGQRSNASEKELFSE